MTPQERLSIEPVYQRRRLRMGDVVMIQMGELSSRDHQDELFIGQVISEERVSPDDPRGGQVE